MENIKTYSSSPVLKFTIYLAGYNKDLEYRKVATTESTGKEVAGYIFGTASIIMTINMI